MMPGSESGLECGFQAGEEGWGQEVGAHPWRQVLTALKV